MSVTIKLSKLRTLELFIKDFLMRKSNLDTKIRAHECNDIDICKDLLLEEYFSGMLIVLKLLGFSYNMDEKQIVFNIDAAKRNEKIISNTEIIEGCKNLKTEIFQILEEIKKMVFKKEDFDLFIKIEGKFHFILGIFVAFNKLNIGINVKTFLETKNEIFEQLNGDIKVEDVNDKNNLLTEPETYKYLNDEINLLDSGIFDILTLNKIVKYQRFEKKVLENRKNLLKITLLINENSEIADLIDKEAEAQRQSENKIKNFEEELVSKFNSQIKEIERFINKYYD